ncbi:DUF3060 domain-containing protein [Glutamicibacter sp. ZJUTW]|uniref:DUF3060 domain-containing protein n=1 Tax=Glutamicibacter sp. ZJUTW TaxID=1155384 RepID=UPI0011F306B4|nr:DUF3060 domain-containing protein [Glutamicibacter sp. ZJUTW]QEP08172.1 DUF3060 domain-containing protein [Glutamicibacter sp. ZJUTW]
MFSKIAKRFAGPLAVGFLAVALSGCVSIESSNEETSAPENAGPIEGTVTPSAKASEGAATGTPNVPKSPADSTFQSVYDFLDAQATEVRCTGSMDIADMGQMLKLVGDCENVTVSGDGNMIVAPHITNLELSGNGNIAAVKNIKQVAFSGIGNSAASLNENAKFTDNGSSNKFGEDAFEGITF